MNSELRSIKHSFDIAIAHLDYFYPLITSISINPIGNINYSLFTESTKQLNDNFRFYLIGNVSINKTISDAKLYLDETELKRFYVFAKDAISIKQNHLDLLPQNNVKEVNAEINIKLENIFFENCRVWLIMFPTRGIGSNSFFLTDLISGIKEYFNGFERSIDEVTSIVKALPPQPIAKQKPELNGKLITFKNSETIEKIHAELKGYFPNKEAELLKALQGEQLTEKLLFPHNQNKFVEVFRRLKYNGFLLNTDTETKNWICTTFQFIKRGVTEPQPFNENSVWNNLNKGKGEPTKKERIFIVDWLPYKSTLQLEREAEKENL